MKKKNRMAEEKYIPIGDIYFAINSCFRSQKTSFDELKQDILENFNSIDLKYYYIDEKKLKN